MNCTACVVEERVEEPWYLHKGEEEEEEHEEEDCSEQDGSEGVQAEAESTGERTTL